MSYRPPFYKRYPQDYLSSPTTRKMTLAEHGIYNKLLDASWLEEPTATLPAELPILSKLTGIDQRPLGRFRMKYPALFRRFTVKLPEVPCESTLNPQRIYNPRLMAEYEEFLQTCEKKRLAGIESGKARQQKRTRVEQEFSSKKLDSDKEQEEKKHHVASVPPSHFLDRGTKDVAFSVFWKKWPRRQAKQRAHHAWMKIQLSEYPAVMLGLEKWRTSDQWTRGIIPHPATWLN